MAGSTYYCNEADYYTDDEKRILSNCTLCPRECHVNRFEGEKGYCGTGAGMNIATVCLHMGEEPPFSGTKGICNLFFSGCNLRCIYCQNHEISRATEIITGNKLSLDQILEKTGEILDKGIKVLGFVSPSHSVPQMKAIIRGLREKGRNPVIVYNTNCYDKPEILRGLAGLIDVYLPDFKYVTPSLAIEYSDSADYAERAIAALKEMYYQKGSSLRTDHDGLAENGIVLRHLVLPGHADESKLVLRKIAEEISTGISISLMSQYYPVKFTQSHPLLKRTLYSDEYSSVVLEMQQLGFRNGWIQDLDSFGNYRPDFSREDHPFT